MCSDVAYLFCSLDSLLTSMSTVLVETDIRRYCDCLVSSAFGAKSLCGDYNFCYSLLRCFLPSVQVLRQVVGLALGMRLANQIHVHVGGKQNNAKLPHTFEC